MRKTRFPVPVALAGLFLMVGCAGTKPITFMSQEPGSELSLVPFDNLESIGTKLKNPAVVQQRDMSRQAVRISSTGKSPVYWFAPADNAKRLDIKVKQLPACGTAETNRNRPLRLLLKSYQSLSARDYVLTRELAIKAAEMDPTLAAPHILTGLSFYQQGKKEEARVAFNKARALDPEDQEISELLRLVQ